jgi:hypothetical protein
MKKRNMRRKLSGFTFIELLVMLAIIVVLVTLALPLSNKVRSDALTKQDKAQIKQIHAAFLNWSKENKDVLPRPGLIARLPPPGSKHPIPGEGPEHHAKNHTRHLYSSMIAAGYFNPELVVGPTELNPFIVAYTDYNYDAYDPPNHIHWDGDSYSASWTHQDVNRTPTADLVPVTGFRANHSGTGTPDMRVCHTSYAHMAIFGERKYSKWRNSADSRVPILGTRGTGSNYPDATHPAEFNLPPPTVTFGVALDALVYEHSYTLKLHGPANQWVGNIVFADNHVETIHSFFAGGFYQPNLEDCPPSPDNIYAAEFRDYTPPGLPTVRQVLASNDNYLGVFFRAAVSMTDPHGQPWNEKLID